MEFRTKVDIPKGSFEIQPCEAMLFAGSCFADSIGRRFQEEQFRAVVNPYGVMYNPVSVLHTIKRHFATHPVGRGHGGETSAVVVITLGTNRVYILKETGEVVDNCQKRPQKLFGEKELSVGECADALSQAIEMFQAHYILTVSPIRYRKYGYHGSQLSKATLLLAANEVCRRYPRQADYFPAYEIMNDELRDYRFYKPDMLHPSDQAVEYIWQRLVETYFSKEARQFIADWKPVKEALQHRPFHPESDEYKLFKQKTMLKVNALSEKYPTFAFNNEIFIQ